MKNQEELMLVFTAAGKIIIANETAQKTFNLSSVDIFDKNLFDLLNKSNCNEITKAIDSLKVDKNTLEFDLTEIGKSKVCSAQMSRGTDNYYLFIYCKTDNYKKKSSSISNLYMNSNYTFFM